MGWGADTLVFCWRGDRILNTLAVALNQAGLRVGIGGVALTVSGATTTEVLDTIAAVLAEPQPAPEALAASVLIKEREKYDQYLSDDLLARAICRRQPRRPRRVGHFASISLRPSPPATPRTTWALGANASPAAPQTPAVLGVDTVRGHRRRDHRIRCLEKRPRR